jgi:cardiolipin synthase
MTDKPKKSRKAKIIALFLGLAQIGGFLTSIRAIMEVRTAQGAIAWAISLNTFPVVALPAYWVFGRNRFSGYVDARRAEVVQTEPLARQLLDDLTRFGLKDGDRSEGARLLERLARLPFTVGNTGRLLVDGDRTFAAIFEGIASAREYVLVQFYILRDDDLGQRLQQALIAKARAGVRCYVLYDEIGNKPGDAYRQAFAAAGITLVPFNTRQGENNRFQLNFRNHRKIVIVDGQVAYVGGHNVGDEYLGLDPELSPWRDTHVEVRGPVVQCVQVSFIEDWYWATKQHLPDLNWTPRQVDGGPVTALCLPSGPADELETATLYFFNAINLAKKRLWIATPYFVPDEQIISALQSAALRGVDVRILIPKHADSKMIGLSAYSFLPALEAAGVKVFRYKPGFMHQKVMLVDENTASVGTANFDNRSFRLNFEITMVLVGAEIARDVEAMLLDDFTRSEPAQATDLTAASFPFRFGVKVSRLMAPIQ